MEQSAKTSKQHVLDEDNQDCGAGMHCSRPIIIKRGSSVGHKGVIGITCIHTVPVANWFLSSPHHESFAHYETLLWEHLLKEVPDLRALLLDINCQSGDHARRDYPDEVRTRGFHLQERLAA